MLNTLAGWVAPAATMIAAVMTASNLGARVTGWGFVVFTVGSIAWCVVALTSGQSNLLWTNSLLIVVNLLGVWRWLGRQARFDDGAAAAAAESRSRAVDSLAPLSKVIGAAVTGPGDQTLGRVVDAMVRCEDRRIAYYVISDGGLAGVREILYAVEAEEAELDDAGLRLDLDSEGLSRRDPLDKDQWPSALPSAQASASGQAIPAPPVTP